ncbi:hypothetical protein [Streptomyces odonnellii]|uniref:hypothetical protein n=1 Tax=Streptomyces odonnellii TaxID=1417980 RepID=UPI000624FB07|nr:hypothetical protein [Streptomyces odonnellii]
MRTRIAPVLTATALTTGMLLGAPAAGAHAADYPVSNFDVTLGNTYTSGTITWYNRSVVVAGEHKSVDPANCRGTTAFTLDSGDNQLGREYSLYSVCGASDTFSMTVSADVPGGAAVVRVCLDDGAKTPPVKYLLCKRYGG